MRDEEMSILKEILSSLRTALGEDPVDRRRINVAANLIEDLIEIPLKIESAPSPRVQRFFRGDIVRNKNIPSLPLGHILNYDGYGTYIVAYSDEDTMTTLISLTTGSELEEI